MQAPVNSRRGDAEDDGRGISIGAFKDGAPCRE